MYVDPKDDYKIFRKDKKRKWAESSFQALLFRALKGGNICLIRDSGSIEHSFQTLPSLYPLFTKT